MKVYLFGTAIANDPNFRSPNDRWIWSCDEIIMRGENLPHCHFIYHKSHTWVPGRESMSCAVKSQWETAWAMSLSAAFTDLKLIQTGQSNSCCKCKYSKCKLVIYFVNGEHVRLKPLFLNVQRTGCLPCKWRNVCIRAENGQKWCATLLFPLGYKVIQHLDHSSRC